MSTNEKTLPRQKLAPSAKAEGEPILLTHSLIDFLRSELRVYKAVVRRAGMALSVERLAQAIQNCAAVRPPVEFSPETLRRFMNHDPQEQGDDFLRAAVQFLLHEKWLTQADIAAHDKDANVRAAVALQAFLHAQPGKKTLEFYREIEGSFVRFGMMPDRIVREVLYVSMHADPPLLRAWQEVVSYRTSAGDLILRESDGLKPVFYAKIEHLLKSYGEQVGAARHCIGFGIADPKIISFFLRSELTGDTTVYLVHTIALDENDRTDVMFSTRYAGWAMFEGKAEVSCEMRRVRAYGLSIPNSLVT